MKKISLFATLLLVAGVVMATSAFTHPIAVRNGVVTDYSAGSSLTIRNAGFEQTYAIRGNNNLTNNGVAGLGTGAHVTVFAQCFPTGGSRFTGGNGASGNKNGNQGNATGTRFGLANPNYCVALFVVVDQGASNGATSGATTPSGASTTAPAVTSTPSTGSGTTATAMPSMTDTPTVTPTP